MVRTDFKEQKLEKFFFETDRIKPRKNEADISLAEEDEEEGHKQFLKGVENFEDKILEKTDNDIVMKDDSIGE